ncbi:MAG TPA: AAA family ATPase [Chryseolinea sp.]|nr:AAA family ATPase [Chryseolinea sp.]
MKIILKHLTLRNFKGIRSLDVPFDQVTNIHGRNGTGKTSVFDGFLWMLFGKDSTDRSTFEIKTLDENNEPYHKLEHEVIADLIIDGQDITIRKVYREKWVKKAGAPEAVFSGHDNSYYWNDVPLNEKEYTAKIATFINEGQFKLLTNLGYFNTVLKWQDRRASLLQLAGGINDLEVAHQLNKDGSYDHLINALQAKKTVKEYSSEILSKKKKIKDESENLPHRISEARYGLPEEIDYLTIENKIAANQADLAIVEDLLMNKSVAQKAREQHITNLYKEQGDAQRDLMMLENHAKNTIREKKQVRENNLIALRGELRGIQDNKSRLLISYTTESKRRIEYIAAKDMIGRNWDAVNAETFLMDPNSCICPTCRQDLPGIDAAAREGELRRNFNQDKSKRLAEIADKGLSLRNDIAHMDTVLANIKADGEAAAGAITGLENRIADFETEHTRLSNDEAAEITTELKSTVSYQATTNKIALLTEQINAPAPEDNNIDAIARRRSLVDDVSSLNRQLATKGQREKALQRIADLEKQESESAQALADLERMEFTLLEFDRAKMDLLEERINGKFRLVKFKLFDRQVNGGETPQCVTLINGVPYPDANTASRINASLDIINVFSEFYGVIAPVFIDNRESVTDILPTESQVINLIVAPADTKLRIGSPTSQVAEFAN